MSLAILTGFETEEAAKLHIAGLKSPDKFEVATVFPQGFLYEYDGMGTPLCYFVISKRVSNEYLLDNWNE
jgi:hypothetical protein